MAHYLLTVLALVLMIEGLMPALSPRRWRVMMFKLMQYRESTIRRFGLIFLVLAAIIMYIASRV